MAGLILGQTILISFSGDTMGNPLAAGLNAGVRASEIGGRNQQRKQDNQFRQQQEARRQVENAFNALKADFNTGIEGIKRAAAQSVGPVKFPSEYSVQMMQQAARKLDVMSQQLGQGTPDGFYESLYQSALNSPTGGEQAAQAGAIKGITASSEQAFGPAQPAPSTKPAVDAQGNLAFASDAQIAGGGYTPPVSAEDVPDAEWWNVNGKNVLLTNAQAVEAQNSGQFDVKPADLTKPKAGTPGFFNFQSVDGGETMTRITTPEQATELQNSGKWIVSPYEKKKDEIEKLFMVNGKIILKKTSEVVAMQADGAELGILSEDNPQVKLQIAAIATGLDPKRVVDDPQFEVDLTKKEAINLSETMAGMDMFMRLVRDAMGNSANAANAANQTGASTGSARPRTAEEEAELQRLLKNNQ